MGFFKKEHGDWRKSHLFGRIVSMTLGGLVLLVLVSMFLIQSFDASAAQRELKMVEQGFARQIEEFDAVIVPQVNWDKAVIKLDHSFSDEWADFNLGDYLYTFNGFSRSFVLDPAGRPIYAAIDGERGKPEEFLPFAGVAAELLVPIRESEAERGPFRQTKVSKEIITKPIQANGLVKVDGAIYIVVATLVQPDHGAALPKGPRAPVAITALPIDQTMLKVFAKRYLVDDLVLIASPPKSGNQTFVILRSPGGEVLAALAWTPRQPGTVLLDKLKYPLALALVLLCMLAWSIIRSGAGMVDELIASEMKATHLAHHDTLTSLPNRALLFDRLQLALAGLKGGGDQLAVMCIDLDRFKQVNDAMGHHAGDLVIWEVARRLQRHCGENAMVARLGGDEFTVLYECRDRELAGELAANILAAVHEPIRSEYGMLEVGCSIGVAMIDCASVSPSEAMRCADLALYRAKELGRKRLTFFEPEMDIELRGRHALEVDLRQALNDGALTMVYQPQVNRYGEITAVEALLRWSHPTRGAVPPGVFIPLAEKAGLILAVGEFVLREVFAETRSWSQVRVAINVSAIQVRSPGFAALVTRLVAQCGVDPQRYELELTETALLGNDPVASGNIDALKRLGFSIALADFGTGYSSLSVLQQFSVDKIKIDRSFVNNLGGGSESAALIDSMVKLARALGLKVIAEGVETEEQMDQLAASGCREFQGHFIGMPIDGAEIAAMLGVVDEAPRRAISLPG